MVKKDDNEIIKEFLDHYDRFHKYMAKSNALFATYATTDFVKSVKHRYDDMGSYNKEIIKKLQIEDPKIIEMYNNYRSPCEYQESMEKFAINKKIERFTRIIVSNDFYFFDSIFHYYDLVNDLHNKVFLEQSIVTACSGYECFLKEMIPWILKNNKKIAKKYLGTLNDPIKKFGKYQYEIYKNIDKIYYEQIKNKHLPVFDEIVDFYKQIIGINLFYSDRERKLVEKIFNVRHCIIHNEGKPDRKWKMKMGDTKLMINRQKTFQYMTKIHLKLHDFATDISKLMNIDPYEIGLITSNGDTEAKEEDIEETEETGIIYNGKRWRYHKPRDP